MQYCLVVTFLNFEGGSILARMQQVVYDMSDMTDLLHVMHVPGCLHDQARCHSLM